MPPARSAFAISGRGGRGVATWACLATLGCWVGCGSEAASPFGAGGGAGGEAGGGGLGSTSGAGGAGGAGAGPDDPTLGGPCAEGTPCDDGASCTVDACDLALGRCRFSPDDGACSNGIFCDGAEVCTPRVGCEGGPPHDCGDGDACTVDTCDEGTQTCRREPRDADGDGDPDGHCDGGGDCDDQDPARSSSASEACGNGQDDDCDGDVDEPGCVEPAYDDCEDALAIEGDASLTLSMAGTDLDVAVSCAPAGAAFDAIVTVQLPAGAARDVDVRARATVGEVSVALAATCGDGATELACGRPLFDPSGAPTARALARSVDGGDEVAVVVTTSANTEVALEVSLRPATSAPTHETCGTALALTPGVPTLVDLVDATDDLGIACLHETGELVFRVPLVEAANVDAYAASTDGDGLVALSVRSEACALPEDELACRTAPSPHVFRSSVPAGDVFVALAATAPTRATLVVELSPATAAPAGDACENPLPLAPGDQVDLDFALHQDDHAPCTTGAVDAALAFSIEETSDVLLLQHLSGPDPGGLALTGPSCGEEGDVLACAGETRPVRLRRRSLAPGGYAAVAETFAQTPQRVDLLARPAAPALSVPFADACDEVLVVPPGGAFFTGNTAGASADFDAGCDDRDQPPGGAPDRLLQLDLEVPSRVVLDMTGTTYDALLDVRRGDGCPGAEVPLGCTVSANGYGPPFLDLSLEAGTYFLQIDGRGGDAGAFQLDVHVVPM